LVDQTPRVGARTDGRSGAGPGISGARFARYQFSEAVCAPRRDRSCARDGRSPVVADYVRGFAVKHVE